MSIVTISALFTQSNGQPATGLTLADIDLTLIAIAKATGTETLVWNTQNPTRELTNIGMYQRDLSTGDLDANNYFAMAQYTGASTLDSDFIYGVVGDAAVVEAIPEITSVTDIPTTPTVAQAVMLLYMALRNDLQVTTSERRILNDAGVEILDAPISDDNILFTQGKLTDA